MQIIELDEAHRGTFAQCLEDWSADAKEGSPRRASWIEKFLPRGLRAQLAVDGDGRVGGMIQYLPVEQSVVAGEGLYYVPCIWVLRDWEGHGNFQGHGTGSALLEAAEADARRRGAKGMAAWGIWLPVWMKASWFKKHGYRKADRQGIATLVWKPFAADAKPPHWFAARRKLPEAVPGKVTVDAFVSGWCTAANCTFERAKRAAAEFGDKVVFREVDASEHATIEEWGLSDALFIDGKQVRTGPPPTYEKIRTIIERRVRRL